MTTTRARLLEVGRGWLFQVLATFFIGICLGMIAFGVKDGLARLNEGPAEAAERRPMTLEQIGEGVFWVPLWLLFLGFGAGVYLDARKLSFLAIQRYYSQPGEPEVIYLRPFKTSGVGVRRFHEPSFFDKYLGIPDELNPLVVFKMLWRGLVSSPEERFLNRLWHFGRVTTVARPGDTLPFPGAFQVHIPDDEWRDRVLAYVDRAPVIAIRLSNSENLMWEIGVAVASKRSALLFWYPPEGNWGDWDEPCDWTDIAPRLEAVLKVPVAAGVPRGSFLHLDSENRLVVAGTMDGFLARHAGKIVHPRSAREIGRSLQLVGATVAVAAGWWCGGWAIAQVLGGLAVVACSVFLHRRH
jgi:hypothetical protein